MTVDSEDKLPSQGELLAMAVQFDVGPIAGRPPHWTNRVYVSRYEQPDGSHLWAVNSSPDGGAVWSRKLQAFEYQPLPSSRDEKFFADHRFSFAEAMTIAQYLVDGTIKERNGA